jgi:hypothetical protein
LQRGIRIAIGVFIAGGVANLSPYDRYGVYWWMIFVGVAFVYLMIVWLLQLAWSHYRRSATE